MPQRTPLFLARSGYRSRRFADAARLLPIIGMFLLTLPVFWGQEGAEATRTGRVGVYLFIVWGLIIAAAALLAPRVPGPAAERGEGSGAPQTALKTAPQTPGSEG